MPAADDSYDVVRTIGSKNPSGGYRRAASSQDSTPSPEQTMHFQ